MRQEVVIPSPLPWLSISTGNQDAEKLVFIVPIFEEWMKMVVRENGIFRHVTTARAGGGIRACCCSKTGGCGGVRCKMVKCPPPGVPLTRRAGPGPRREKNGIDFSSIHNQPTVRIRDGVLFLILNYLFSSPDGLAGWFLVEFSPQES
jgi:hypothetical protein